ncbi:MAG: response regulator [Gemmatimonadaceae bacterium]
MAPTDESWSADPSAGDVALSDPSSTAATILVIDDEDRFRGLVVRQLVGAGFNTVEARDGSEAIQVFSERGKQISAVLLDLVMPNRSGTEVLTILRAYAPSLPVVITSGYAPSVVLPLMAAERGVGFLGKPFSSVELATELRRVIAEPMSAARHAAPPRATSAALRTVRILLVEDNPDDQDLVRRMLRKATDIAFEVEAVSRLADAITQVSTRRFDAVLVDLSLPDARNLQTVRHLREVSPDLPLIALTGRDDMQTELAALAIGAQDYLIKGRDDARTLVRSIRHAIERKRLENEQLLLTGQLKKALAEIHTLKDQGVSLTTRPFSD